MSKTNVKSKKKTTGFDIMYRVVTAILAIAVFPVTYFMNLVYYALDWSGIMNIINNFKEIISSGDLAEGIKNFLTPSQNQAREITDGYICLAKWDEFEGLINSVSSGDGIKFKEMLMNQDLRALWVSLALFAVVLVLALVILIIAIVSNKSKIIAAISGVAFLLGTASNIAFTTGFANPLVNGDKSISKILGIESILGTVATEAFGNVIELRFDNAFYTVIFLMLAICIWSVSVIIVNSDDKAEKALREAKKAEKKAKKAEKTAKKEAKKAEKAANKAEKIVAEEKKDAE